MYPQAVERIGRQLASATWLSPAGLYLMRDLVQQIIVSAPEASGTAARSGAEEHLGKILAQIQVMEQALSLKEDFPRLGLEPRLGPNLTKSESHWLTYGQKPWLVGLSPAIPGEGGLLVAVDFQTLSSALATDADYAAKYAADVELVAGLSADGMSLGSGLQGIQVAFAAGEGKLYPKQGSLQRLFYFLALVVVLSVTLFGAYLLWRDIRREVLMAEMRSQFVSSVSHELKTPLTAIRMFAETLRLGRAKDPATQAEYLDTIVNESERLTRLLNNVLDFSKIEQGQRTYHPAPASLPETVQAAARAMEYPLKQQGFELDIQLDEGLPQVRVDRDAIEQAVLNLLSNAMKYSGDSRTIGLKVQREGDRAVIQVVDKGVGIDPKDQEHIFEDFYRVPTRENQSLPGTGLGLSLVSHIAKAHGGTVRVESAPGRRKHLFHHPALGERAVKRILVVEDDLAILRGLKDNLEFESYEVLTEGDGERGYAVLKGEKAGPRHPGPHASQDERLRALSESTRRGYHDAHPDADRTGRGDRPRGRPRPGGRRLRDQAVLGA